jgi:hypothetical protein
MTKRKTRTSMLRSWDSTKPIKSESKGLNTRCRARQISPFGTSHCNHGACSGPIAATSLHGRTQRPAISSPQLALSSQFGLLEAHWVQRRFPLKQNVSQGDAQLYSSTGAPPPACQCQHRSLVTNHERCNKHAGVNPDLISQIVPEAQTDNAERYHHHVHYHSYHILRSL